MSLKFVYGVKHTDATDIVVSKLQPIFEQKNFDAWVTSVLRTSADQLGIITNYAQRYGFLPSEVELDLDTLEDFEGQMLPTWQVVWSKLLNRGIIINPPVSAEVLMNYWRDGINKKGRIINPSPHASGKSFDIGGFNSDDTIDRCYNILVSVQDMVGIRNVLLERVNNCIHNDVF